MESLARKVEHIYTLQDGDVWTIYNHHLVIANPDRPPFMIELATGKRIELCPTAPCAPSSLSFVAT